MGFANHPIINIMALSAASIFSVLLSLLWYQRLFKPIPTLPVRMQQITYKEFKSHSTLYRSMYLFEWLWMSLDTSGKLWRGQEEGSYQLYTCTFLDHISLWNVLNYVNCCKIENFLMLLFCYLAPKFHRHTLISRKYHLKKEGMFFILTVMNLF